VKRREFITVLGSAAIWSPLIARAQPSKRRIVVLMPEREDDIETAMTKLAREPGGGLIVPPDGFLINHRKLIIELAARDRLPAIYGLASFAVQGGLASYGVKLTAQFSQAAVYVDRILRGEKPAGVAKLASALARLTLTHPGHLFLQI